MSEKKPTKVALAGFTEQKDASPALKYGFIGLGQAGGKMVDAFASLAKENQLSPYPCIAINTNLGDLNALEFIPKHNKLELKGYEKGAGKNREIGRTAFVTNGNDLFVKIEQIFVDCEIIYVCANLGGGSGSGAIKVLSDALSSYLGKRVINITALPRPNEIESMNAFEALREIFPGLEEHFELDNEYYVRKLEGLIILDNEKIWNDHKKDINNDLTWDIYSNHKLASILHEWNVLTSLPSPLVLDSQDLLNHIYTGGNVLTFAKKEIKIDNSANASKVLQDIVYEAIQVYKEPNVLADDFDYQNDLRSMAMVLVVPKNSELSINQDTLEELSTLAKQEFGNINFMRGLVHWSSKDTILVYMIGAFGNMPARANKLREEALEFKTLREQRENASRGFDLGDAITHSVKKPLKVDKAVRTGTPFGSTPSTASQPFGNQAKPASQPFRNSPFGNQTKSEPPKYLNAIEKAIDNK